MRNAYLPIPRWPRWIITLLLLIVVWRHSHWSVALSLTLIAFDIEVANYIMGRMIDLLGKVANTLKDQALAEAISKLAGRSMIIH